VLLINRYATFKDQCSTHPSPRGPERVERLRILPRLSNQVKTHDRKTSYDHSKRNVASHGGGAPRHNLNMIRRRRDNFRWQGAELLPYKEDSNIFKSVTRQKLFEGGYDLPVELRYFEVGEGGHSTLERHEHAHLVMVIRGCGRVLVGERVEEIDLHDVVHIPPMTWHQFQACRGEELGFVCVVNVQRDKPQRPEQNEVDQMPTEVAAFVKL
jgi:mannose-6-phosphate isomerase-like protein (cupin superfamily)